MAGEIEHCAGLVRARDPDRYLATLYAPRDKRPALFALHALDLELLDVALGTSEPMIGQIRLAWWRERLAELDGQAVPAQPVLKALSIAGLSASDLEGFDDASLAYLDGDVHEWAHLRGTKLFAVGARILDSSDDAVDAGHVWAAVDGWRRGLIDQAAVAEVLAAAPRRMPAPLRPIAALTGLARSDFARNRAILPGQPDGVSASPTRQLRLAAIILSGRI